MINKKMKEFDELTIQDDFIFYKLMQNKGLCTKIIQTLLSSKIGKIIELTPQNIIKNTYGSKGVRLDILAKDEKQRLYNIEMQMMNEYYIVFRLRYYQASIDISSLESGQGYNELPNVIIVFLCNKDSLAYNLPVYTLKNYCLQTNSIVDDGTTHMIINYSLYELIKDEELRAFCRYCKTKEITSKLTEEIDNMISNIKQNELARQEYSFLFNRYPDDIQLAIQEGRQKGVAEGILTTAKRMKENDFDISTIAKITGLSKQEIEYL
ncbi:MAG: Rpn family recombination-promoting nuclease/putative transposase [Treponema sp.]